MELIFFYPSNPAIILREHPQNRGIDAVLDVLEELERRGVTVRRIDAASMTDQERFHEYSRACTPAVCKRYEVKRMFGTNRQSAIFFGLQVPALIVKQPGDPYGDTYPHRERPNTIVTIYDFLSNALANFAAERAAQG
jgi:hypothetical protein